MGETYPIAGVYENVVDYSSYILPQVGAQAFIPFTALQGVFGVPTIAYSKNGLRSVWGNPYTDGLFASELIVNMRPVLGVRVGWVAPNTDYSAFTNMESYFQNGQHLDSVAPTYIGILQRRSGAFEIYRTVYSGAVYPDLHDAAGVEIVSTGALVASINVAKSLTGLKLDYDASFARWYADYTPSGGVTTRIYGYKNDVDGKLYFYNPNGAGKISVVLDSTGVITGTGWTIASGDSFKVYCYVYASTSTKTTVSLLRGYLWGGNDKAVFTGNVGSIGEDMALYIAPATYTDSDLLETISITVQKNGVDVENFTALDLTLDPTDNQSLEKYIDDHSQYIRLYKDGVDGHVDLTNIKALTKNDFITNPTNHTYYNGIIFTTTGLTRMHVAAVTCNPRLFSYYDLTSLTSGNHAYEGSNTVFRNVYGVDDISYFDRSLTEYHGTTQALLTVTSTVQRDAIVTGLTNDIIPSMNQLVYDFNLAWSSIQDDTDIATVHNALMTLSAKRNDFFTFTDLQDSNTGPTTAASANTMADSLSADWRYTLHCPRMQFKNNFTQQKVYMGTGFGGLYATVYNDANGFPWYAPAGYTRGKISDAIGAEFEITEDDATLIHEFPRRINPIMQFPGEGYVVWGQKSGQIKTSALDRINVARGLLYIMKTIKVATRYLVFEQNTQSLWSDFISLVDPVLKDVLKKNGLYDYKLVCSSSNNTGTTIDRNEVHGAVLLKFVKTAEKFVIDYILTTTDADFNVYLV